MLVVAVWIINLGYGFEGSFQPLRSFDFVSEALGGTDRREEFNDVRVGNRFAGSWVGDLPVLVPANYLLGIDLIKFEEEKKYWSYLRGEWRLGGWWYYYLYAMAVKEPVGTWVLVGLAVHAAMAMPRNYRSPLREELLLIVPLIAVIGLVSSQTGFNHHVRYVLPAFPFLFILVGRLGRSIELGNRALAVAVCLALGWATISSLRVVPHSLSYYNELVGGPTDGHYCLGESNTDWGQDLLYLKSWLKKHPTAKPLHFAYDLPLIDPKLVGIDAFNVPVGPHSTSAAARLPDQLGPLPGCYAVSANKFHNRERDFDYFLQLRPVGMAGYSIYIYDITLAEANRVRRELGMPPLPAEPSTLPSAGPRDRGAEL